MTRRRLGVVLVLYGVAGACSLVGLQYDVELLSDLGPALAAFGAGLAWGD